MIDVQVVDASLRVPFQRFLSDQNGNRKLLESKLNRLLASMGICKCMFHFHPLNWLLTSNRSHRYYNLIHIIGDLLRPKR